jgi:hypothetical protein
MRVLTFFLLIVGIANFYAPLEAQSNVTGKQIPPDFTVALQFINDYAKFCDPGNKHKSSDSSWIQDNLLLSKKFKACYTATLDSAKHVDPELGLGFDPIFDAQDFPDKGFSILKTDTLKNYVTVVGTDWKEFELVLKLAYINNKWLVDGAGIINIPKDKQAKR